MDEEACAEQDRPVSFGRRKIVPRACIADRKRHIRTFLADALDELHFVTFPASNPADVSTLAQTQDLDLVVLGLSPDGIAVEEVLQALSAHRFAGQILVVGAQETILMRATMQLASELGLALLPALTTPFSAQQLRHNLASLLPGEPPPSLPIDVAEALKAGWLELHYQHKIHPRTLMPRGFEAVTRLRHPAWGLVPPAAVIGDDADPAQRRLSEFVVERALGDWHYAIEISGPVNIAINLPVSFFEDHRAVRELCARVPAHPAFGGLLVEVKCSEIVDRLDFMRDVSRQIRFHNIGIAIDNIGCEWPSLMGFDMFPFAELKADRQFVKNCGRDRLKKVVCSRIADLSASYGVPCVAEGVETQADLDAVHNLGFDLAQGFLFGDAIGIRKLTRRQRTDAVPIRIDDVRAN